MAKISNNSLLGSEEVKEKTAEKKVVGSVKLYREDCLEGRVFKGVETIEMMKRKKWKEKVQTKEELFKEQEKEKKEKRTLKEKEDELDKKEKELDKREKEIKMKEEKTVKQTKPSFEIKVAKTK